MNSIDLGLLHALNSRGVPWLDRLFLFLSSPYAAVLAGAAVLGFLLWAYRPKSTRVLVALTLVVGASDLIGARLLKPLIGRVRPCYALPSGSIRIVAHAANVGSMPSLHAANFFAAAFVLTMLDRRMAFFAYPVAILVAMSRVYLGVHWPSDVLAGAVWGTVAGLFGWACVMRARPCARHRPQV